MSKPHHIPYPDICLVALQCGPQVLLRPDACSIHQGRIDRIEDFLAGGYSVPSLVTLGSQVHHWSFSTLSITSGTWFPHPCHVVFSAGIMVSMGNSAACIGILLQVLHVTSLHIVALTVCDSFEARSDALLRML